MKLILQAIKALFRKIEAGIDTADTAKATADTAKATANTAKATANNAYTMASKAVKLVNVTIPKSMASELVTLLNGLQTGKRGKVTYNGKMFSTVFSIGGNVLAKLDYSAGSGAYSGYMLMNSTDGYKALGFLHWDYTYTGTDTKIFFIQLRNLVSVSYIEAIRLA